MQGKRQNGGSDKLERMLRATHLLMNQTSCDNRGYVVVSRNKNVISVFKELSDSPLLDFFLGNGF
jgi:hypothetical protein